MKIKLLEEHSNQLWSTLDMLRYAGLLDYEGGVYTIRPFKEAKRGVAWVLHYNELKPDTKKLLNALVKNGFLHKMGEHKYYEYAFALKPATNIISKIWAKHNIERAASFGLQSFELPVKDVDFYEEK